MRVSEIREFGFENRFNGWRMAVLKSKELFLTYSFLILDAWNAQMILFRNYKIEQRFPFFSNLPCDEEGG